MQISCPQSTVLGRVGFISSVVIDTHCHLTFPDFAGQASAELDEAHAHGVTGCITISTTSVDCQEALAIARSHDRVWCSSGVHPLYSDKGPHNWDVIRAVARDPKCVAWGELGLDNHYPEPARSIQDGVLAEQLSVIENERSESGEPGLGKPIVIHCREAFADLIPVLKESPFDPSRFVFHCFTGNADEARMVLDFGASISFTGVVTYKNAKEVQEAARIVPIDRIMVETDAPFLSPMPKRGERPCRPWMTSLTAKFLAELRGEDWDAFHQTINDNTERFFGIDVHGAGA
ncbi:MAG: TatD family deoxyribonuclease [Phycisphaera sp.]|nr:MAG: TatD family deoxyribonuclease [Phycisphaera sp.]